MSVVHQKSETIRALFDRIAKNYDRANDLLSFGIHRRWKAKMVRVLSRYTTPNGKILDVATGTGDIALRLSRAGESVVGIDFSFEMLEIARERERRERKSFSGKSVEWREGNALHLPFGDGEFSGVGCAFGVRNFEDPGRGIQELWRCVSPGGVLVILEFGNWSGQWFLKKLIRLLTWIRGNDHSAYEYLIRSSEAFPAREEFLHRWLVDLPDIRSARFQSFSFGIVTLYVAEKLSQKN